MIGIALLGATGSIGETAQRVVARHPERFRFAALTANGNRDGLAEAVARWAPAYVGLVDAKGAALPQGWGSGAQCLVDAAQHPDVHVVLNAVVGAAGLDATLAALTAGKRVALANKETLVIGGALVQRAARAHGGSVIPVDSEHSALLQCLAGRVGGSGEGLLPVQGVKRFIITASGGPFRTWDAERVQNASIAEALNHPTWAMGRKITIDSASLANKALEVIEAHVLFGVPYEKIEVVVHPQSIIHSMVEFEDGSVLAQMGVPSMELPVLYALTYPERLEDDGVPRFDPVKHPALTFEPVRHDVFPTLSLGIAAGKQGGAAPAVFNAANEAAVARVLDGSLMFARIPVAIERALAQLAGARGDDRDSLLAADAAARRIVQELA
ncbi:1-deoxy-D-xylulose-5-phosphate reductoisomerase [Pseudogemmatithrix spongiicola]|uniref:1-deoxy-D-xylulose 5-phosphate reductoisomerase n=1 Tax=Pseudogemmatithrix spongiicola TaxID=3062599 RepID=A0AA49K0K9_9BACT|nr:1-deoxy-D-xylulose-5-phosphate reductoisomerase [Gemmatimonadaceae bacterium 'strain 138']WKW15274.1 1-deoxy-D-xylulose-5-phosphate reductoisomerase [Gemmatimonadaceae bacterium 'strain 318']